MSYSRPSQKNKPRSTDFWATIERPTDTGRVDVIISGVYGTEADLRGFVRHVFREGDTLRMFRRETTTGGYRDVPLVVEDEPVADPARLKALVARCRRSIEEAVQVVPRRTLGAPVVKSTVPSYEDVYKEVPERSVDARFPPETENEK